MLKLAECTPLNTKLLQDIPKHWLFNLLKIDFDMLGNFFAPLLRESLILNRLPQ